MITINIPATFNHSASIYQPVQVKAPNTTTPRYYIGLPADECFHMCKPNRHGGYNALSAKPPMIMIGDDHRSDVYAWERLCETANRWRIPLDFLLINRPLTVAVELWTPSGPFTTGQQSINLVAVRIGGDLDKSANLEARVQEIKSWLVSDD